MGIETILGGASLVSGIFGASSAKKQQKAAERQAQDELALQEKMYNEGTARLQPWVSAGNNGLAAYLYELGLGPAPTFGGTAAPTVTPIYSGGGGSANPKAPRMEGQAGGGAAYAMSQRGNKPGTITGYRAGDKTFQTAAEAQAYADSLATPGTAYEGFDGNNPYRTTSTEFTADPGYQFRLDQGLKAVEGSAAARGGLYSGATMTAMQERAADEADQTYGDWYNRYTTENNNYLGMLAGLSGNGQNAAAGQTASGQNYAQGAASAGRYGTAGQIAGYQGMSDAVTGTINDMAGIAGYFNKGTDNNPMGAYASSYNGSMRPRANPFY